MTLTAALELQNTHTFSTRKSLYDVNAATALPHHRHRPTWAATEKRQGLPMGLDLNSKLWLTLQHEACRLLLLLNLTVSGRYSAQRCWTGKKIHSITSLHQSCCSWLKNAGTLTLDYETALFMWVCVDNSHWVGGCFEYFVILTPFCSWEMDKWHAFCFLL